MTKELILSLAFLGIFVIALIAGFVYRETLVGNVYYLLAAVTCLIGHVVMAHLAFNQFKTTTEPETANKESTDDDGGNEKRESGESGGFDD